MAPFLLIIDIIGYIATAWLIISGLFIFIAWFKGILIPVWRLGNGLAKRKITIFAKGDNKESFENLLLDTNLFSKKNIQTITKKEDFGRCENSTLYLVNWADFRTDIDNILIKKDNKTALIVFSEEQIPPEDKVKLGSLHNVMLVNFRGRLLNDILVSLMITGYEKR